MVNVRKISKLDPRILDEAYAMLEEGQTAVAIAAKLGIDRRWISEIRKFFYPERYAKPEEEETEQPDPTPTEDEALQGDRYKSMLSEAVPLERRVEILHEMVEQGNDNIRKWALDRIDALTEEARAESVPALFKLNAQDMPDFRRRLYSRQREYEIAIRTLIDTVRRLHEGCDDPDCPICKAVRDAQPLGEQRG